MIGSLSGPNVAVWTANTPINVKPQGGRPGIGGGFELRPHFLLNCPSSGQLPLVKKYQLPRIRQETLVKCMNQQKNFTKFYVY